MTYRKRKPVSFRSLPPFVVRLRSAAGLTLLELILVISLLVVFVGIAVLAVDVFRGNRDLDLAGDRLKTVIRLCRAEARNRGRAVRIRFDSEQEASGPQLVIEMEADPLGAPGRWTALPGSWGGMLDLQGFRIAESRLTGESTYNVMAGALEAGAPEREESTRQPICFKPDGQSDSAVIHLRRADDTENDGFVVIVTIDGVNSAVASERISPRVFEERESDRAEGVRE